MSDFDILRREEKTFSQTSLQSRSRDGIAVPFVWLSPLCNDKIHSVIINRVSLVVNIDNVG